ncbi:uncharacterized protein A4U43_C05F30630 [Asparagus officinalis]|uniref:Protodermal factor 1 n=1 Tax=Asparagus officinalis TaxID=4686 RepID=A0A5P1EVS2_ASPOF|nr:protodermal factor 1 [Asparagus officinalis]ONK70136.1 uncharacterized protein A4U43_C05F30630 [Asparagus officinalis]
MEARRGGQVLMISFLLTVLFSQSHEREFADQKTYYPPDPHSLSRPPHSVRPPKHHHRTPACPPPPQGGSGCGCTPSHGGGSGSSPATHPPSPSGGGGGYYGNPPPSPIVEPISPPTPTIVPTPDTPSILTPPSPPLVPSPPFIPVDPNTPPLTPSTPPVDPNSPPFTPGGTPGTCIFWSSNPTLIWGIFGYWATVGGLFGPVTTLPFSSNLSVQEALANTRNDGYGALYREATASYLNSLVNKNFPFTTPEVRHGFVSSMVSEKAAANQARVFKLANEGRFKKH